MAASKAPKRITRTRLRNVAVAYVRRYGGSSARLRQVLQRRAERSLHFHGEVERRPEVDGWIEAVVDELCSTGVCDDAREARQKATQLLVDGKPRRVIAMKLRSKGFAREVVDEALRSLEARQDEPDTDWVACCRLARRRGLGPFGKHRPNPRPFDKQLAILMRAAFPYALARRVLEADDPEALEAVIDAYALRART